MAAGSPCNFGGDNVKTCNARCRTYDRNTLPKTWSPVRMIKFIETNTRSKPKPFDGKALASTTSPIALNSQCNTIIGREICNEKVLTLVHFECAHTNTHRTNVYEWSKTTSTSHSQSAASSFSAGHLTCHFERYAHTSSSRTSNISCRTHELRGEERNVEI